MKDKKKIKRRTYLDIGKREKVKDYKDKTAFVELDGEVKEIPVKQAVYIRLSFKF